MATVNSPSATRNAAETIASRRKRLADQIGNRLYTAALYDRPIRTGELGEMLASLSYEPPLRDILQQAPRVAAGDPLAVRPHGRHGARCSCSGSTVRTGAWL